MRHESYFREECYDILRARHSGFVIADTAGKVPYAEEVTAVFVYGRLHGSRQLYASSYTDEELDEWAAKLQRRRATRRDVYFDNDMKTHAPFDAERLARRAGRIEGAAPDG